MSCGSTFSLFDGRQRVALELQREQHDDYAKNLFGALRFVKSTIVKWSCTDSDLYSSLAGSM